MPDSRYAGEIVICIIADSHITNNKQYTILELTNDNKIVLIKNDDGIKCSYYPYRFVSIDKYRERQLDKLGI